eukprot:1458549-Rhodomonas_salina.1
MCVHDEGGGDRTSGRRAAGPRSTLLQDGRSAALLRFDLWPVCLLLYDLEACAMVWCSAARLSVRVRG